MKLAKPHIDIGLFTNQLDAMCAFWQQEVGLRFDHMLPLGGGVRQHRHELLGSVLKINHARDPLPGNGPSGYRELLIARDGLDAPRELVDPDGNRVRLVPPGSFGVSRIGLRLGVRDAAAHARFYRDAMGLAPLPGHDDAFLCGDSVLLLEHDPAAPSEATLEGAGYRYITVQVFKTDEAHQAVLAGGGREGRAPVTLGSTARISFVRDPDGNWIEISQRASITGSLEP